MGFTTESTVILVGLKTNRASRHQPGEEEVTTAIERNKLITRRLVLEITKTNLYSRDEVTIFGEYVCHRPMNAHKVTQHESTANRL